MRPSHDDEQVEFWTTHGLDQEQGGFFGTLDQQGAPVAPYDKGVVNQARHLWTWSTYYHTLQQLPLIKDMAKVSYKFLTQHHLQTSKTIRNAAVAVWAVSQNGSSVTDPSLSLYGNMFAIFGIAKFAEVFNSTEAAALALQLFSFVDFTWHDKQYGGYDETTSLPVFDLHYLPGTNRTSKSFDTQMHCIEALGQLYLTSKDSKVLSRLLELLTILNHTAIVTLDSTEACKRVQTWLRPAGKVVPFSSDSDSPTNSSGWISLQHLINNTATEVATFTTAGSAMLPTTAAKATTAAAGTVPALNTSCSFICAGFDLKWGCLPSTNNPILVNVGHNLEGVHLFTGIIDSLLESGAIEPGLAASLKQRLLAVGMTAAAWGYDSQYGGVTQPGYFAKSQPYTKVCFAAK
jgi:hypothetical protein